jgi:hypothetical protein
MIDLETGRWYVLSIIFLYNLFWNDSWWKKYNNYPRSISHPSFLSINIKSHLFIFYLTLNSQCAFSKNKNILLHNQIYSSKELNSHPVCQPCQSSSTLSIVSPFAFCPNIKWRSLVTFCSCVFLNDICSRF